MPHQKMPAGTVPRSHILGRDAGEPAAAVICFVLLSAALRAAQDRLGTYAVRDHNVQHDPVETAADRGTGAVQRAARRRGHVIRLSVPARVHPRARLPATSGRLRSHEADTPEALCPRAAPPCSSGGRSMTGGQPIIGSPACVAWIGAKTTAERYTVARAYWVPCLPFFNQFCSRCPRPHRTITMSPKRNQARTLLPHHRLHQTGLPRARPRPAGAIDPRGVAAERAISARPQFGLRLLLHIDAASLNPATGAPFTRRHSLPREGRPHSSRRPRTRPREFNKFVQKMTPLVGFGSLYRSNEDSSIAL